MEATAMASSPPPRRGTILSILPPELLVDVLSLVSPQDVASFAQTCHDADSLVYGTGSATDNLWRRLFLDRCDKPPSVPPPVDDTTTSSSSSASVPSSMRSSLKALSRARTDLRHGARRQPALASSHGRTLRTLVQAMESRALRRPSSSLPNPNDDIPPSLTAATLASMFPANYVGDQRWSAFVYPREKVKGLSRWQEEAKLGRQRKLKMQEEKARKTEAAMAKKKAKTKARPSKDTAAGSEETTTAAAAASSSSTASAPAPAAAASSTSPSQTASSRKRRRTSSHAGQEGNESEPRRSARIQRRVAAAARDVYVPSELLDFLEEAHDRRKDQSSTSKKAQAGPSSAIEHADDDDVVSRLEALAAALDEEAAAQLHVLHGVRLMRMPTEDEKQRLVAKARRRKRKEIEEMAKERKKAKAAAVAGKGKGKGPAQDSDADDTDVQADSSQGNENVKGKAAKSKKPSSSKATAARRRRVRKAMNDSDEDELLLHRGYQSQDGDGYAQYPSVMSAQNAPALPLPAVTVPAYGQLPRLFTSSGKGIYHEPRLHDGPSDDERDKAIKGAIDDDEDNGSDVESLNSDARMDEFFEFRMMVDEAYHDGYFDSREHRDAVIQGRASPPPHIDDEMARIHDRLKRGKSLDDPPSDDDANGQDYDSDASYTSPPPPSMTPSDFSDDWTPGLDFDTEHSVHQVNSFLGASKGPGGDAMLRREAKELVYDAGRYAFENAWGPFKPFRSGGRGGRRAIGPWEMMQLGLLDDEEEEEDEQEDNEQIEEVVDMETLDAQAAAQGITWEPGQDESDDSGTPAPTNNAAAQAIADYPTSTTTAATTTVAAAAPASDLAPTTTDDEDFESDDGLSSGPSMSDGSDDSDDDAMHFGGVGPTDFARMVQRVGSYAGVKVRNRFEDEEKERKSTDVAGQASSPRIKVDWLLAEAIMIVVHANLHHAIHRRGWGSGFILPRGARGDDERTLKEAGWWRGGPGPLDDCSHKRNRRLLYPHAGWAMSRGEERPRELPVQRHDDEDADDDKGEASSAAQDTTAPAVKDWANVESATWMGTYFFLDYPHFLRYNSRLATEGSDGQRATKSTASGSTSETGAASELLNRSEATGDCLALRLTLRPANRQAAEHEEGEEEAATYGPDDPEFPTLRFSGRTYTFMSLDDAARLREQQQMAAGSDSENEDDDMMNEDLSEDEHGGPILPPPTARGHAHGFVRPVYSEDPTQQRVRYHAASGRWLPLIVAIQWRVTHAYEGADRWSLSGVQAGPPGTRAPIYGTWSDVERDDGSPLGPFAYFNVDSRPWAEVERLRQEEVERKERAIQARRQKARELRLQRQQEQGQGQQQGEASTTTATAAAAAAAAVAA